MKKTLLFVKRNLLEMVRDPLLYIFCAGFPVGMLIMFQIIMKYSNETLPTFEVHSIIPGIIMFSYCLLMLMGSLLVSKDKTTAFLKRLYTSPLKPHEFIIGYFVPFFIIGIVQTLICISAGYIVSALEGKVFISFGKALLLVAEMMPIMITNIMLGILFGTILNDKSAPAISSIFISASGIVGGAWMPVETMGDFEKVVGFLPFYPSTYLGRVITGGEKIVYNAEGIPSLATYEFGDRGLQYLAIIFIFMITVSVLSVVVFNKKMSSDRF